MAVDDLGKAAAVLGIVVVEAIADVFRMGMAAGEDDGFAFCGGAEA